MEASAYSDLKYCLKQRETDLARSKDKRDRLEYECRTIKYAMSILEWNAKK